jgi:hypothetical protein
MAAKRDDLVVGVFDHTDQAEKAIADLWKAGFAQDRIDMATRSEGVTTGTSQFAPQKEAAEAAVVGAEAGAVIGAAAGAVAMLLLPGVGWVLGGGLLASLLGGLGGAALGAAGGTFLGPFVALEMSEDDARFYSRAIDEGRTVVLVQTPDRQADARAVLDRHGAHSRETARPADSYL